MSRSSGDFLTLTGFTAGATFAAKQYYICKLASTAGQVIPGAAATDVCLGIVQNDPAANEEALIATFGTVKAAAEASVSAGDELASSTTGRVKTTTTENDDVIGIALEASSTAGDIITIKLVNYSKGG